MIISIELPQKVMNSCDELGLAGVARSKAVINEEFYSVQGGPGYSTVSAKFISFTFT